MKLQTVALSAAGFSALVFPSLSLANTHGKSAEAHGKVSLHASTTTCAKVPPGHFIARGWLKKHAAPTLQTCQTLPKGILSVHTEGHDTDNDDNHATSTDSVAPVIANVTVSSVGSTTATVAWDTNEAASGAVFYSTTTPLALSTISSAGTTTLSTSHSFNLSGLTASTTYFYAVQSKDASGNTGTGVTGQFTTTH